LESVPLISIVDDDGSVRDVTQSLIRSLGYNVETFASTEEFLGWIQIEETACLITDVQMPGLSGVELQDRLISDGRDMLTIFISAFPNTTLERQVRQSGAIAYLPKPLKEDQPLEHIDTALKRRRGRPTPKSGWPRITNAPRNPRQDCQGCFASTHFNARSRQSIRRSSLKGFLRKPNTSVSMARAPASSADSALMKMIGL
jgi:DNA-binding NtrC family response regulator